MNSVHQHGPAESALSPSAAMEVEWITEDLVTRTQDVWGRHLRRQVDRGEAIEMLLNVQNLALAFHLASTESEPPS